MGGRPPRRPRPRRRPDRGEGDQPHLAADPADRRRERPAAEGARRPPVPPRLGPQAPPDRPAPRRRRDAQLRRDRQPRRQGRRLSRSQQPGGLQRLLDLLLAGHQGDEPALGPRPRARRSTSCSSSSPAPGGAGGAAIVVIVPARIVLFGATGYTGRLTAAALREAGAKPRPRRPQPEDPRRPRRGARGRARDRGRRRRRPTLGPGAARTRRRHGQHRRAVRPLGGARDRGGDRCRLRLHRLDRRTALHPPCLRGVGAASASRRAPHC